MNWKWILGAFLIGLGLPMFVYGAVGWMSANAKLSDLIEVVVGLISAVIGFYLVIRYERKNIQITKLDSAS